MPNGWAPRPSPRSNSTASSAATTPGCSAWWHERRVCATQGAGRFEQNLRYLGEYARAIAFAAAGTADRGALSILARFLGQLPTTYAYTRHLLDATSRGSLAVALAALLPCQWSYGEIGRHLARSLPADPVYRDWIALFSGDGYGDLVAASTRLLDESCTAGDQASTSDTFDRSVRYEVAFWQMAYTRGESDRA
jgi:thiaminase (transcriptional activator TenA)